MPDERLLKMKRRRRPGAALANGHSEATIMHVAHQAGVSQRTVSRVINESPLVHEQTRSRVQAVIRSLDYRPSMRARALASKQSFMIGLVHDDPNAVVLDHVQRGIFAICTRRHYELVVHPCHFGSASLVDDVLDFARRTGIDGLVLIPPVAETLGLARALKANGIPTVGIASVPVEDYGLMLVSQERLAVASLANYLVSMGHRRFGLIAGPGKFKSAVERKAGFLEALVRHGIRIDSVAIREGDYEFESGMSCAAAILSCSERPTAIFASNDRMAAGVLKVAAQMGIAIPQQLSVVGFDDSVIASMLNPSLTTVCRPMKAMAEHAARWLTEPSHESIDVATPCFTELSLVIRDSAGPAPAIG